MVRFLGQGGVGDCFIIILKLKETGVNEYVYTHVDKNHERLLMSHKLLDHFNVPHEIQLVKNIPEWHAKHSHEYDKNFNVFAKGYIDIPRQPYHWEPCKDEGFKCPFPDVIPDKGNHVVVQVNGGVGQTNRHWSKRDIADYVSDEFDEDEVIWVGSEELTPPFGTTISGNSSWAKSLEIISTASAFVGYNSVLLYWALYNKVESHLFMDHQGYNDLRIHDNWKPYLEYVEYR